MHAMQVAEHRSKSLALVKLGQLLRERLALSLMPRLQQVEQTLSCGLRAAPAFETFTVAFITSLDVGQGGKRSSYLWAKAAEVKLNPYLWFGWQDA
jgi:hypothetical protein